MLNYDLIVIGGGEAGLLSSIAAKEAGVEKILLLEMGETLGGKLNNILETGFGLNYFRENLIGPQYAQKLALRLEELGVDSRTNVFVLEIRNDNSVVAVSDVDGIQEIKTKAVIIATGFREIPRGINNLVSSQCAGVYASEVALKFVNQGYRTGNEIIISGANDNGLLLAKRMIIEGINVKFVIDANPFITGTRLNYNNLVEIFKTPIKLGYSIVTIHGDEMVEGVTIVKVDENNNHIEGSEEYIECDNVILAINRKPEVDLLKKANITISSSTAGAKVNQFNATSREGVFAVGNAVYIHDWLEDVYDECFKTGKVAAEYIRGKKFSYRNFEIKGGDGIRFIYPQVVSIEEEVSENINVVVKVDREYKNKKITVKSYHDIILEVEKELLLPGEKEMIELPKEFIYNNSSLKGVHIELN